MPDAKETRLNNLKKWLDRDFDGTVASFCRYYSLSSAFASYMSQVLSGSKPFGERAARKLEEQTAKPVGWLDTVHDGVAEPEQVFRFDPKLCAKLPAADKELVEQFIALVLQRFETSRLRKLQAKAIEVPQTMTTLSQSEQSRIAVRVKGGKHDRGRRVNVDERRVPAVSKSRRHS